MKKKPSINIMTASPEEVMEALGLTDDNLGDFIEACRYAVAGNEKLKAFVAKTLTPHSRPAKKPSESKQKSAI